ncbi:MAG: hypothetical protein HRT47_08865 [Candidatus Caenarcaniphilales bacterium]|nr:hypothetical protein [Candidatus Caenarcaniphilales bacterium]
MAKVDRPITLSPNGVSAPRLQPGEINSGYNGLKATQSDAQLKESKEYKVIYNLLERQGIDITDQSKKNGLLALYRELKEVALTKGIPDSDFNGFLLSTDRSGLKENSIEIMGLIISEDNEQVKKDLSAPDKAPDLSNYPEVVAMNEILESLPKSEFDIAKPENKETFAKLLKEVDTLIVKGVTPDQIMDLAINKEAKTKGDKAKNEKNLKVLLPAIKMALQVNIQRVKEQKEAQDKARGAKKEESGGGFFGFIKSIFNGILGLLGMGPKK